MLPTPAEQSNPEVVEQTTHQPTFSVITELPQPVESSGTHDSRRPEYPSSIFVDPDALFVADGHGMLYSLLLSGDSISGKILASYELRLESAPQPLPFQIHAAQRVLNDSTTLVLSARSYSGNPQENPKRRDHVEFDLWGVEIPLTPTPTDNVQSLNCLWQRTGREVPVYSTYHKSPPSFHIFGVSPYARQGKPISQPYTPTPDEIAPIPRAGESLETEAVQKPPPYSWTQTSDSITMAFPLPSTTSKSAIKVTFSQKALNLLISDDLQDFHYSLVPLPRYIAKPFWDGIQPSTSLWTWDKVGEKGFGILTLYLDKRHEGTRWSQVFAPHQTPSGEPEPEVAETLDPSELYNIREALEKYTSSLSEDGSGLGLGQGVPSLGKGETDEELDSSVGRETFLTRIPLPTSQNQDTTDMEDQLPVTLLSTPLPGSIKLDDPPSLIIKNDIDGLFCTPTPPKLSDGGENLL